MSDFIDDSCKQEEQVMALRLANRPCYEGISATHCVECGEEIPQGRRDALPGVKLCVECVE